MRIDNSAFAEINDSQWQAPQFVVSLDFGDSDLFYLTSHAITGLTGENVIEGVLVSISGTSQKLNPDKANAEIGSLNFEVLDDGLTALQADRLSQGKGLRGKTVRFYVGDEALPWSSYILATTQIVDEAGYKDLSYSFKCADVQRMLREDVFKPKETRLNRTLEADSDEIEVLTTNGFEPYQHPNVAGAVAAGQKVGLLHLEGDDDDFEIASYTGKEANKFTGVTRGLFGTTPLRIELSNTTDSESSPKVTEFIYLEMPGPMLAYAVLTGAVYGHPGEYLPEHWQLGVPAEFIRTSDFESIGEDLWVPEDPNQGLIVRLAGLEEEDGKKFLEEEVFLLMGCYPPIYSDGQLGMQRMTAVHSTGGYVRRLDADTVADYGDLTHDMGAVINEIFVSWNWDIFQEELTRLNYLPDMESIRAHGQAEKKELEFRGLYSSRHSSQTIQRLIASLRDRYAGPPLRLDLTLTPDQNDLEVGDIVRVDLFEVQDYTGTTVDGHLNRNFEIQQISTDWRTGKVKVKLFGSSQKAGALPPQETGTAIPDEWYERGTEISPTNFPGVVTVSGGVTRVEGLLDLAGGEGLGDEASFFWCPTDLTCDDAAEIRISDNVALLVRGFFSLNNAKINGKGRGYPGGAGTTSMVSTGGYFFNYGSRWDAANKGTPGFIDIQSTPQGGRGYQNRGTLDPYLLDVDGLATMRPAGAIIGGRIQPGQTPPPVYEQDESGITLYPVDLRGSSGSGGGSVISNYDGFIEYERPGGDGGAGGAGLMIVARGMTIGVNGYIDVSGAAGSTPPGPDYSPSADPQLHIWAGSGGPGGPGACYILIDGLANAPSINERTAIANGGDLVWAGRRLKPYKVTNDGTVTVSSDKGPAPQQGTATTSPAPGAMVWETAFTVQILTGYIEPVEDEPVVTLNPPVVTLQEATNTPRTANANLSTIEVGVQPPSVSNYAYGLVEYREKGQAGWFEVGPASPEATFVVPSDGKTYEVQVRGVSLRGKVNQDGATAEITTTKVSAPGDGQPDDKGPEDEADQVVPAPPVTGMELFQQGNDTVFGGKDVKVVWRKNSVTEWVEMGAEGRQGAGKGALDLYFKDYQVEVWADVAGLLQLVRTEWVVDPEFIYTYEKNAEDFARETGSAGAWREMEFRVYCRGRQNQISAQAARLSVENVAPPLPGALTISAGFRSAQIDFEPPEDLDYRDSRVWMSQSTGFTPGPENLVAQQYGGPVVLSGLTDNSTYYLRFATYDAFGQGTISSQFTVTTPSLSAGEVEGLSPWATVTDADRAFIDANLANDAIDSTKIVKLTASKIVTGTLAATEKISVEGQVESVVGDAVATLGPKSADGKTGMITYQYAGTTLFAVYSDGSAAFSGSVVITGGSGYSNLSDKPGSLADINSTEADTLTQASADAAQAILDAADAQAAADGKVASFYQSSEPTADGVGDLWVDSDTDRLYRWDGTSWVEIQDEGIGQALSDAATAQGTADSKILTFYQAGEPTAQSVGDLWVDTDDQNRLHRWDGSVWQDVRDAAIGQALAEAAAAQSTADGKIQSFYQASEPASGMSEGDLWFDTDDGNRAYRYDGTAWQDAQDSGISTALSEAADAQATADGKVTTYFSTSTPTAEAVGDLWYNDSTKLLKRWNGTTWDDSGSLGADWYSNLSGIPSRLGDTPSTGLNLTATHLGYYDGASWTAYIDDNGDFYFGDGGEKYIQKVSGDLVIGEETDFRGFANFNSLDYSRYIVSHLEQEYNQITETGTSIVFLTPADGDVFAKPGSIKMTVDSGVNDKIARLSPDVDGLSFQEWSTFQARLSFEVMARFLGSDDGDADWFIGKGSVHGGILDAFGFRYFQDSGASGAKLYAWSSQYTGSPSYTAVELAADPSFEVRLGCRQYSDRIEYYVDRSLVATITTNLPVPTNTTSVRFPAASLYCPGTSSQLQTLYIGEARYLQKDPAVFNSD